MALLQIITNLKVLLYADLDNIVLSFNEIQVVYSVFACSGPHFTLSGTLSLSSTREFR